MSHVLELRGCTPEPLMAYLKALGIFRLVAEQKDPTARVWWQNDDFFLRSALDRNTLMEFFLEEYRPTPIVAPWNKDSSFKPTKSQHMNLIVAREEPRFELWNKVVPICRQILSESQDLSGVQAKDPKAWMLRQCRIKFPDDALDWLDATYVLTADRSDPAPLFGRGATDAKLEFTNNFMRNIAVALNIEGAERRNDKDTARARLLAAIFNEGSPHLEKDRTTGFYNPSSVKAPNASVGFEGERLTNPWDYVLLFEGALLFAGAVARRLSSQASKAAFPFTVESSSAGYGTSVDSEYGNSARTEFWAPLWSQPINLKELIYLVSEGRAQIGRRQVSSGTDFARAIAGLGTERGISQFQRYGVVKRSGDAHLAAPLGRFYILGDEKTAERANVLFDLDGWMQSLRNQARGSKAPASLGTILRQVEGSIIEFCQRGGSPDLRDVLIAIGQADRWVSRSGLRERVKPLINLSREWVRHADDGSAEFRLARSMASIFPEPPQSDRKVGHIRENLEAVAPDLKTRRLEWKNDSTSFVWTAGDPLSNMLTVLERRCLEGQMTGMRDEHNLPLNAAYSARLKDVVAFLGGHIDVQRVTDLALPLSFVRYRHRLDGKDSQGQDSFTAPFDLPAAYAVMKLTLLPGKFVCHEFGVAGEGIDIAMEPSMLAMLRAGRVKDAYRVAHRRLKASGLQPLSNDPGIRDRSDQGRRLAAALLFPLDKGSHKALAERALRKPTRLKTV